MSSFKEFIDRYQDGSIVEDASWRAYDFEAMVNAKHAASAAWILGIAHAKHQTDSTFSDVAAAYSLPGPMYAKHLLGLWYLWDRVSRGHRVHGPIRLIRREAQGA